MTKAGKGILAMDESNATCGSRLEGVGVENTEENRREVKKRQKQSSQKNKKKEMKISSKN